MEIVQLQTTTIIASPCFYLLYCILFVLKVFKFLVGNDQIRGANDTDKTEILQWLSFGDSEILPPACTWIFPLLGVIQYNKEVSTFQ